MAKKYSSSRTTDGVMVFSNGFVDPNLAFNTVGNFTTSNLTQLTSKLRVSENKEFNLSAIKTKFYRENNVIKNSYAAVTYSPSQSYEYYPHKQIVDGQGGFDNPYKNTGFYENIFAPTPEAMFGMNNYRFTYKSKLTHILDLTEEKGKVKPIVSEASVKPAIFNPLYMISIKGLNNNVPLLNSSTNLDDIDPNITDCTIKELVSLSQNDNSILGKAKYRYADFMYCKDLGKVSNNHLITLRVFPFPVGDHIQHLSAPTHNAEYFSFMNTGDIGRLVTWFGTDDNKLEDILKYEYHASWRELNAQIEEVQSQEDDQSRGPLGMIINTFSPQYNKAVGSGFASSQSLWGKIGGSAPGYGDTTILTNYDKNKVYEPKDTVQSTHTYEGKLEFTHEFTLNFSYKLRAYDNINPKSALLDLIGNITAVTYRRGHFWGGDRKMIGPQQNTAAWQKANKMIDQKWDEAGSIFNGLLTNGINFQSLLGCISGFTNGVQQLVQGAMDTVKNAGGPGKYLEQKMQELNETTNFTQALKGKLKNQLGRPALYAMQSLLTGDDVGLWHVTIGNPKNPIASIGNLIVTNASITHSGPLGIDDFPTDLKVSVTLKHARGRDAVDIQKMYTMGIRSLYSIPREADIDKFYGKKSGAIEVVTDEKGNKIERIKEDEYYAESKESKAFGERQKSVQSTNDAILKMRNMAQEDLNSITESNNSQSLLLQPRPKIATTDKVNTAKSILLKEEKFNQTDQIMIHRVLDEIR